MPVLTALRLGFASVLVLSFAYVVIVARDFAPQAKVYPMLIGYVGLILALLTLVVDTRHWLISGDAIKGEAPSTASTAAYEPGSAMGYVFGRAARFGGWLVAYIALMYVIGLVAAAGVFVLLFLLVESKLKWRWVWILPVAIVALLLMLADAVNLFWPFALFPLLN